LKFRALLCTIHGVTPHHKEFLIAAPTPYVLEQGVDWFTSHYEKIKHASRTSSFWKRHTFFIQEGQLLGISSLVEKLQGLGYERTFDAPCPGEFLRRGGFVTVFPVNAATPWRIEFLGNTVERITPLKTEKKTSLKLGRELEELKFLKPGDYVVHTDHGIGVFRGLGDTNGALIPSYETAGSDASSDLFFIIEYAPPRDGRRPDRLLVPLSRAEKISPYFGFETPRVHRLGGDLWFRAKKRVKEEVLRLARELLLLYVKREITSRPPCPRDTAMEKALAASFPHIETHDQLKAIEDITADLSRERPMDRILVGDVGFGKTEVAVRAAAQGVFAGKQVALLAPTTILAWQHVKTFRERFASLPVTITPLSRLLSKKELRETLLQIQEGKTDIVIGTHRLLSRDVKFKNLGVLIIDEEQRFGVRHKEQLKNARTSLDVLSLSATPIPRTMYLALSKIRTMSVLKSSPPGRLPIKTFVMPYSRILIQEAIEAELARNGQIYFLHNRIATMEKRHRELKALIPRARFAIMHGRLSEKELIRTLEAFREGKIDVLVATTIIENGLDLSNVNTLIIADSARLGLGEAHQIRGRIGRRERQAYAYFLFNPRTATSSAKLRLKALHDAAHLGAGYHLALKDLEIRGAGNVLGKEQSGAINAIGLNLYLQMLSRAVEELEEDRNA